MALSKIVENSISDGVVSSAKLKDFAAAVDLNGVELILDADQDTSITADTDDRIDFKLGGVEHISLNNSSGDTVIKPMVDAKDIIFQQYDGNKILEINDGNFVGIGGNASAPGEIRIYEDTDNGTHYTGFKAGNNTASVAYVLPTADGSASQALVTDGSGTLSWSTISTAYDDLTAGDAALNITTTAGNITIDAQGNDTDIIFKGTDGGADRTYMTIDGSAGGDLFLTGGLIDLKNDGSAVSQIKFYCESSNAHAQTLIGAPHSESATNTLTLPSTGGNSYLLTAASTATVTNKTFTSPKINEDVALTATATELNLLDGVSGLVQADLTKLAAIDATAAEINLIDGGATVGTTAVADGDGIIHNDGGTMKVTSAATFKTYFQSGISTAYDDLTAGDAAVNITTSSGNITIDAAANDSDIIFKGTDNSSDITMLTLDGSAAGLATFNAGVVATTGTFSGVVDADAGITVDNITMDGTEIDLSSGDLTVDVAGDIILDADGADVILKDGGTEFGRFTNSSSDFVVKSAVSDKDIIFKGNDGGSEITAMTIDMSEGGHVGIGIAPKIISGGSKYLTVGTQTAGRAGFLEVVGNRTANAGQDTAIIKFVNNTTEIAEVGAYDNGSTNGGNLKFSTSSGGTASTKLEIKSDGRGLSQFTAKAWCQMDMSNMSINDSHNVGSITDIATGQGRVNFSNSMGNASFAAVTAGPSGYISATSNLGVDNVTLHSYDTNGSHADTDKNMLVVFGD